MVVQSAISTFNNAALRAPDFFWVALLCLPVFVAAWMFAPQLAERFLPDKKTRDYRLSVLAVALIFLWVLTHENFAVLRDGASYIGIVAAFVLYFCTAFLSREYYERKLRLSQFLPVNEKWGVRIDWAVPFAIILIAGWRAMDAGWEGIVLQAGAVAIGWVVGFLLNWKSAREGNPKLLIAALMFACVFGLIMQPEFFRFGQLAHLTAVHLLSLAAAAATITAFTALHFFRPRGWLTASIYRRAKLIARMLAGLVLVLLFITESAPIFFIFAAVMGASALLSVLHQPVKSADSLAVLKQDFWLLSLGLFGVLTVTPALTAAAVVMWRVSGRTTDQFKKIRDLL